jgi:hypothetical protein
MENLADQGDLVGQRKLADFQTSMTFWAKIYQMEGWTDRKVDGQKT